MELTQHDALSRLSVVLGSYESEGLCSAEEFLISSVPMLLRHPTSFMYWPGVPSPALVILFQHPGRSLRMPPSASQLLSFQYPLQKDLLPSLEGFPHPLSRRILLQVPFALSCLVSCPLNVCARQHQKHCYSCRLHHGQSGHILALLRPSLEARLQFSFELLYPGKT